MANTAKNRLFYGDMGYNKTQSKSMLVLQEAFSFLRQALSVIDLFRKVLRSLRCFEIGFLLFVKQTGYFKSCNREITKDPIEEIFAPTVNISFIVLFVDCPVSTSFLSLFKVSIATCFVELSIELSL